MRVLMQSRANTSTVPGGDVVQMMMTKKHLQRMGVDVDVSSEATPSLQDYDLVHVFGIQPVALLHSFHQIINAKKQGVPLALSTIYWSHEELMSAIGRSHGQTLKQRRRALQSKLRDLFGFTIIGASAFRKMRARLETADLCSPMGIRNLQEAGLLLADILLPNNQAELDLIRREFGVRSKPARVIPNAADPMFYRASPEAFVRQKGLKGFVICAARIEDRKNQLSLIKALNGTNVPLLLIGKTLELPYLNLCRRAAGKNVHFIEHMEPQALAAAYAAAKVHALPSWFETPGIASLEAGLAGCNLVVTERGGTREYFGDHARYCEPDDIASIRDAVLAAWRAPRDATLAEHVLNNYTWDKAAQATLGAYQEMLNPTRS